jgi:hypothetical protein
MTEDDFYAIAKARPDVIRAFCNAVNAVIDMRREAAAPPSSPWADVRLKEKQATATQLMDEFAGSLIVDGRPLSDDQKKLVQSWILRAANFHLQQGEKKDDVNGQDAPPGVPPAVEVAA